MICRRWKDVRAKAVSKDVFSLAAEDRARKSDGRYRAGQVEVFSVRDDVPLGLVPPVSIEWSSHISTYRPLESGFRKTFSIGRVESALASVGQILCPTDAEATWSLLTISARRMTSSNEWRYQTAPRWIR